MRLALRPAVEPFHVLAIATTRAVLLSSVAATGLAQTITVTTVADLRDAGYSATVATLPGPDGLVSFAEAMIAANNTPGRQTIGFAIPAGQLTAGRAVVHTGGGVGIRASDEVAIDGATQTVFGGDTNPLGAEVAFSPGTIYLNADNSWFSGIDGSTVEVNGSGSLVFDNTGMNSINLFSGAGSTVANNTVGTIKIDRSDNNLVVGNIAQRIRVLGWVGGGQPARDNRIGGPNTADRNFVTGYGTWDSQGFPSGTSVQVFDSIGTVIENNWIGTTPDGMAQGNTASTVGIGFEGVNHGARVRDNLIAGIRGVCTGAHCVGQVFGRGIYFNGSGTDFEVLGNTIGLDASGAPTLGSVLGLDVGYFNFSGIDGVRIGGPNPGDGNVLAGHLSHGIAVQHDVANVRISGNSIHSNGGLGIDLVPTSGVLGVTPNDPLDTDTGGNGLQNFPIVTTAATHGTGLLVQGSLDSAPRQPFTLEFFGSSSCDPSGHGEGQDFLGSAAVFTDASGHAVFTAIVRAVPAGHFVTATATAEPGGATSEFSACRLVEAGSCQSDLGFQGPGQAHATLCGTGLDRGDRSIYQADGLPPATPGALFVSQFGAPNLSVWGGTLVGFGGFIADLPLAAGADGRVSLVIDGSRPAFDAVLQTAFLDGSTPFGVGFSNAIQARFGR